MATSHWVRSGINSWQLKQKALTTPAVLAEVRTAFDFQRVAQIYSDDREMLPLAMGREIGKEAALELVAERDGLAL